MSIHYGYDGNNRLTEIFYPDSFAVTFAFDASGNRTRMVDRLGTSTYQYDALNRVVQYTDPFGKTVGNEYDAVRNRTALIYPEGQRVVYGYDALNRMATVTDWLGGVTTYSYDDAGNLIAAVNPNGTKATYAYDNAERLIQLVNSRQDGSVIASYELTLDAVGNRIAINSVEPLAPIFEAKVETYTYDADNRLLTLNGSAVTHDANGNLVAIAGAVYQYDFEDRLNAVLGSTTAQYAYDGVGNRLMATRAGVVIRYTLDISGRLTNVVAENDGAGNSKANYVRGLGVISRTSPAGDVSYYHYDPVGSTVVLTARGGNITDSYAYSPYGQTLNSQGSADNPFRYVGRFEVVDEANGLRVVIHLPHIGLPFG